MAKKKVEDSTVIEEIVETVENAFESAVAVVEDVIHSLSDKTKAEMEEGRRILAEYAKRDAERAAAEKAE